MLYCIIFSDTLCNSPLVCFFPGYDPSSLRGSRTGVFIGCSASEAHDAWTVDLEQISGYEMTGCTRSMFANRVSYTFDFKGPSFAVDTACSSSLLALDQAMLAIRTGQCDAAIIGGTSLCLKPSTTLQFQKLGMLAPDGTCKSYDVTGTVQLMYHKDYQI